MYDCFATYIFLKDVHIYNIIICVCACHWLTACMVISHISSYPAMRLVTIIHPCIIIANYIYINIKILNEWYKLLQNPCIANRDNKAINDASQCCL